MVAQDHVDPDLLFVGTEFGLFFTPDAGKHWVRLKSGLPTIAVRDLCIQKQMNDLVVGTFGRGIYVLDDYTPLRRLTAQKLEHDVVLFPVREAPLYIQSRPYGLRGPTQRRHDIEYSGHPATQRSLPEGGAGPSRRNSARRPAAVC